MGGRTRRLKGEEVMAMSRLRLVWVPLAAVALAGCASTGTMSGQLSGPGGSPPQRVTLNYETDRSGQGGNLSLTLPGGESFTGRYATVGSASATAPAPGTHLN